MDDNFVLLFLGSVFLTVFILSQVLILPTFGTDSKQRKKLQHRFDNLLLNRKDTHQHLLKKKYLDQLGPVARYFESMSFMMDLKMYLEQAELKMPAYSFILLDLLFGGVVSFLIWVKFQSLSVTLMVLPVAFYLPVLWLQKKRVKSLDAFEEQLPEALEMMARSLRTGYPFNECLKIVAEEMPDPIGREFQLMFDEINYGRNLEIALALMMERVPSLSLNAMSASVLIQKETGGNMAEILLKISEVLRGRFKLQRKVKTLSAEGVFSAWVLCLTPFFMYLMLTIINPTHFDALYQNPNGVVMFYIIAILELIAIFWMRKIINIDV